MCEGDESNRVYTGADIWTISQVADGEGDHSATVDFEMRTCSKKFDCIRVTVKDFQCEGAGDDVACVDFNEGVNCFYCKPGDEIVGQASIYKVFSVMPCNCEG